MATRCSICLPCAKTTSGAPSAARDGDRVRPGPDRHTAAVEALPLAGQSIRRHRRQAASKRRSQASSMAGTLQQAGTGGAGSYSQGLVLPLPHAVATGVRRVGGRWICAGLGPLARPVLSGSAASAGDRRRQVGRRYACSGDRLLAGRLCQPGSARRRRHRARAAAALCRDDAGDQAIGFKLFGIRGGLAARLGLQNGDVATRLNDGSLAGPRARRRRAEGRKRATTCALSLLRAGKPIERRVVLDRRKPAPATVAPPAPASPPRPPRRARENRQRACRPPLSRALRCTCKSRARDRLLADSGRPLSERRTLRPEVVQETEAGGVRLSGVRRGSIYAHVGLQNGDLVEKIMPVSLSTARGRARRLLPSPQPRPDRNRRFAAAAPPTLTVEVAGARSRSTLKLLRYRR